MRLREPTRQTRIRREVGEMVEDWLKWGAMEGYEGESGHRAGLPRYNCPMCKA